MSNVSNLAVLGNPAVVTLYSTFFFIPPTQPIYGDIPQTISPYPAKHTQSQIVCFMSTFICLADTLISQQHAFFNKQTTVTKYVRQYITAISTKYIISIMLITPKIYSMKHMHVTQETLCMHRKLLLLTF